MARFNKFLFSVVKVVFKMNHTMSVLRAALKSLYFALPLTYKFGGIYLWLISLPPFFLCGITVNPVQLSIEGTWPCLLTAPPCAMPGKPSLVQVLCVVEACRAMKQLSVNHYTFIYAAVNCRCIAENVYILVQFSSNRALL